MDTTTLDLPATGQLKEAVSNLSIHANDDRGRRRDYTLRELGGLFTYAADYAQLEHEVEASQAYIEKHGVLKFDRSRRIKKLDAARDAFVVSYNREFRKNLRPLYDFHLIDVHAARLLYESIVG